jgi:hypothetical protein
MAFVPPGTIAFGTPLLLLFLATPDQPAPKFPVGKETTQAVAEGVQCL